jgi:hypothetical protein
MSAPRSSFLTMLAIVVFVQGIHVVEHIIQLIQVYLLNTPDEEALGVLGAVFEFQGTEEWLHLVFNATYLLALYLLIVPIRQLSGFIVPRWTVLAFLVWSVGLESWHMVEHLVIITNVARNNGCPCPGIGDAALGVSDTVLHFIYNAITFAGLLLPSAFIGRWWLRSRDISHARLRPL